jgi:hypothetical protein
MYSFFLFRRHWLRRRNLRFFDDLGVAASRPLVSKVTPLGSPECEMAVERARWKREASRSRSPVANPSGITSWCADYRCLFTIVPGLRPARK